jgi:hypothetical protein
MIDSVVKQYKKVSLWIIAGFMLSFLLAMQITSRTTMLTGLVVCVLYFLASTLVYADLWKKTAKASPTKLTGFYLTAMAVKFFLGILVVLAYCLIVRTREQVIAFAAMFSIYYLAMVTYDAIYFSRVEKKNQISIKK